MNIAINALSASSYGGLYYVKNLVKNIIEVNRSDNFFLFVTKKNVKELNYKSPNLHLLYCRFAGYNTFFRLIWEQCVLPIKLAKYRIDSIYLLNGIDIFFTNVRTVICLQNMEVFFYKRYKNSLLLNLRCVFLKLLTTISLHTSDSIVAVSRFVRDYVVKNYNVPKEKISSIYHGRDENFVDSQQMSQNSILLKKYNVNEYIFSASKMVAYANIHNLIKAFSLYVKRSHTDINLVIAGGSWDKHYGNVLQKIVRDEHLERQVRFLGYVSQPDMASFFWNAKLFVFASTLEACPLILIEAMTAGSVIVTSNVDPMLELCRNAALYFDPNSIEDIALKIEEIIGDKRKRRELRTNALNRANDFDWMKSAKETIRILKGKEKNV